MEEKNKSRGGSRPGSGRKSKGKRLALNTKISEESRNRLDDIAKETGRTIRNLLEEMIMKYEIVKLIKE